MRHRRAGWKLNRNINQRKALFKNLISALILRGKIRTTEAKARAIRRLVDKLIARAKQRTVAARRLIAAFLPDKRVVNKLVDEVAPNLKQRPSGFTALTRIARRRGDNAVVVEVELLDQAKGVVSPVKEPAKPKKSKAVKKVGGKKPIAKKQEKINKFVSNEIKVKPQVRVTTRGQAAIQKRGTGK